MENVVEAAKDFGLSQIPESNANVRDKIWSLMIWESAKSALLIIVKDVRKTTKLFVKSVNQQWLLILKRESASAMRDFSWTLLDTVKNAQ